MQWLDLKWRIQREECGWCYEDTLFRGLKRVSGSFIRNSFLCGRRTCPNWFLSCLDISGELRRYLSLSVSDLPSEMFSVKWLDVHTSDNLPISQFSCVTKFPLFWPIRGQSETFQPIRGREERWLTRRQSSRTAARSSRLSQIISFHNPFFFHPKIIKLDPIKF